MTHRGLWRSVDGTRGATSVTRCDIIARVVAVLATLLAAITLTAIAGCGPEDVRAGEPSRSAIVGGADDVDTPIANAVVAFITTDPATGAMSVRCSGTLVTSTLVLTAAHCDIEAGREKVWIGLPEPTADLATARGLRFVDNIVRREGPFDGDIKSYARNDVAIVRI